MKILKLLRKSICHILKLFFCHFTNMATCPSFKHSVTGIPPMLLHTILLCFHGLSLWINRSSHCIPAPDALLHCCGEVAKTSIIIVKCRELESTVRISIICLLFIACAHFSCIKCPALRCTWKTNVRNMNYTRH